MTPAQQRAVIERQIAEWEEFSFNAEISHRVHTRLKSGDVALARFEKEKISAEYAIDELKKMLKELEEETPHA